ncbi:chromate transporter [Mogibacterium neglectum]|uniref:chromate transporter n=1 Tax=Mogibacterium neglectum TaxID=114528 RepID=UPI00272AA0D2|nr:chromate transporter [Mogibacterium neglectum]WLD77028.1 chromate transporter [Mogibacterium neglectum]
MLLAKLFIAFFKIGLFGFGGGLAIIQLIYDSIKEFTNITPEQFANIVAIAQVTPGPVAVNSATYVGYEVGGYLGSALATLGVATPAFIIIAMVANAVERYKESTAVRGALEGIRPATVGLIAAAVITIGKAAIMPEHTLGGNFSVLRDMTVSVGGMHIDVISIVLCGLTILLIQKFKINPMLVLVIIACVGAVVGV